MLCFLITNATKQSGNNAVSEPTEDLHPFFLPVELSTGFVDSTLDSDSTDSVGISGSSTPPKIAIFVSRSSASSVKVS